MKYFLILILFIASFTSSSGQSTSEDYTLTLDFRPSFMSASKLVVQAKRDSGFLYIRIYKDHQTREASIETKISILASKLAELTSFLKTYKFQLKNNIDTIGSHKEFVHGDSVPFYTIDAGTDGINVNGSLNEKDAIHKFAFWSPGKGTKNAELMIHLFDLVDNAITDQKTVNYIEQLQQYFPHQLGLKKLSDNPLTYKLYGSISSDDWDELDNFLKNLPLHRKVMIDMSNFSGMGTMFYSSFEDYCANNKNIYWLNPSFRALIDLYKIGIPNSNVLSKKKIVKIEQKNGREVISSKEY